MTTGEQQAVSDIRKAQLIASVVRCAMAAEGAQEVPVGSNAGSYVTRILKGVGLGPGQPWCAAALADWGRQGAGPDWPLPYTASCQELANFALQHSVLVATPAVGDVFLIWHAGLKRYAHTGLYLSVKTNLTISGNTTAPGGTGDPREGWVVARKPWVFKPEDRFIRWTSLL